VVRASDLGVATSSRASVLPVCAASGELASGASDRAAAVLRRPARAWAAPPWSA